MKTVTLVVWLLSIDAAYATPSFPPRLTPVVCVTASPFSAYDSSPSIPCNPGGGGGPPPAPTDPPPPNPSPSPSPSPSKTPGNGGTPTPGSDPTPQPTPTRTPTPEPTEDPAGENCGPVGLRMFRKDGVSELPIVAMGRNDIEYLHDLYDPFNLVHAQAQEHLTELIAIGTIKNHKNCEGVVEVKKGSGFEILCQIKNGSCKGIYRFKREDLGATLKFKASITKGRGQSAYADVMSPVARLLGRHRVVDGKNIKRVRIGVRPERALKFLVAENTDIGLVAEPRNHEEAPHAAFPYLDWSERAGIYDSPVFPGAEAGLLYDNSIERIDSGYIISIKDAPWIGWYNKGNLRKAVNLRSYRVTTKFGNNLSGFVSSKTNVGVPIKFGFEKSQGVIEVSPRGDYRSSLNYRISVHPVNIDIDQQGLRICGNIELNGTQQAHLPVDLIERAFYQGGSERVNRGMVDELKNLKKVFLNTIKNSGYLNVESANDYLKRSGLNSVCYSVWHPRAEALVRERLIRNATGALRCEMNTFLRKRKDFFRWVTYSAKELTGWKVYGDWLATWWLKGLGPREPREFERKNGEMYCPRW
ncbi:MAG TPA: hypothetical protein PKA79_08120 [Oligoflexia bacterium]|nr:hypothetical protein [Oligoflexia bacterium]